MCGASGAEKAAFGNEVKVSQMLNTQFQQFAGENQTILDSLTRSLTPIQEAGPSQFGLTPTEEAAERTITAEQLSSAGGQVANAVRGALATKGGGTYALPSGAEASIEGALAQDTAVKEALAQAGITQRGYDIGRQNFEFATKGLMEAPGALENPVVNAGRDLVPAAQLESKGAQEITAANRAWEAPVGKLVGAGLSLIPGVGPFLGAAVTNAAGGSSPIPGINLGGGGGTPPGGGTGSNADWGE